MAYSKIILNGETLMDVTSDTIAEEKMLSGTIGTKNNGTKATGNITTKSSSDLTVSGATVTVPVGYYSATASKSVATTTHPNPTAAIASSTGVVTATHTQGTGYVTSGTTTGTLNLTTQAAQTINTSTVDQTIASNRWLKGTQTIKSVTTSNLTAANIASGVIVKVGDANNASRITQIIGTYAPTVSSATVTPTETAQTLNATGVYGYKPVTINAISSTYVGTGVAKKSSADLTASGSTVTVPIGYYSSQATKNVASTTHPNPTAAFVSSTGVFTATHAQTAGYVAAGTTTSTYNLTTQAAQTLYPSIATQYINSYRWLTGSQTIASVTTTNLTANNIAEGVVVKVGDANNASRITQVTGTYTGGEYYEAYKSIALKYSIMSSASYQSIYSSFFSNISLITSYMFEDVYMKSDFTFPNCTEIGEGAFRHFEFNTCGLCTFDFPQVTIVPPYCFQYQSKASIINIPNCISIEFGAFRYCNSLVTISFPKCTTIGTQAFYSCRITEANFPSCITISASAFYYCRSLATISFPKCTTIGDNAFYNCGMTEANMPECISIGDSAFAYCASLTTISFPNCISIGRSTFAYCSNLSSISLPKCTQIEYSTFANCTSLTTVNFPMCSFISNGGFYGCSYLTTISVAQCSSFGTYAFRNCVRLISLYLNQVSSVPIFGSSMFNSTPISNYSTVAGRYGSIYVPSSLYTAFTTATSWSAYSARMVSV